MSSSLVAAQDPPAAGAALDQVMIATGGAVVLTAVLLYLCTGHRSGRVKFLGWAGDLAERLLGMPSWAVLPSAIGVVTLLPALFGLQWDESIHIAQGRDPGPLANPSHYLLLFGIFAGFAAGVISIVLADDRVPRSGVKVTRGWRAPLGGVLMAGGSAVALLGFPLDDVWHRIFGQDVTLWSATHVLMIGGMALAVLGTIMLNVEGLRARTRSGKPFRPTLWNLPLRTFQWLLMPATVLLILSLLQGEFDYGVPQFRLLFHPMLIMGAAGMALVAARIFMGRGAALGAAITFLVIRGVIALIIGPLLGQPDHVFPLYLAEAAIVELVALVVPPRRALRFGLACGALIGTVGLAAEWAWSNVFPIPWPSTLLPEAIFFGLAMAVAGSVLGAWLGAHLTVKRFPRTAALRTGAIVAAAAITVVIGYGLIKPSGSPVRASVTLTDVRPAPHRTVNATVRLDPPDAANHAEIFNTIAWQGGGFATHPMRRVAPGVYRTTHPLPVYGSWKTALRLERGASMDGLPIYLPADSAIPINEVPATRSFTRPFTREAKLLRREAKDVPGWIWTLATALVAAGMMALLYVWALALRRLADAAPDEGSRTAPPAPRTRTLATERMKTPA